VKIFKVAQPFDCIVDTLLDAVEAAMVFFLVVPAVYPGI